MKKVLSLILALLMMALPVFSLAEETAELVSVPAGSVDFAAKYLEQGQQQVTTVSFVPGEFLLAMAGQDYSAAISDLLAVLSVQTKVQKSEDKVQGRLALQLEGEDALWLAGALNNDGVFASSSLLGEDTYQLTPDELKTLIDQASQALVAQGTITQEQLDALTAQLNGASVDPEAAVAELFGQPDLTGLQAAIAELSAGVTAEAVTEAPTMLPDAVQVMTVPLTKETLSKLMEELAKVLWAMPITQKIADAAAGQTGSSLTEEKLIETLKKFPNALKEDTALLIYVNEKGDMYITTAMTLAQVADGKDVDVALELVTGTTEEGAIASWSLAAVQEDDVILVTGDMNAKENHLDYSVALDIADGDQGWRPFEEIVDVDFTQQEDSFALGLAATERIQSDANADPIGILVNLSAVDQDLGDHAEGTLVLKISLENMGDVLTINASEITAPAEAWITDAEAIRPMALSGEEQSALLEKVQNNLQLGLITAMQKLPASVLQILNTVMGGQAQ